MAVRRAARVATARRHRGSRRGGRALAPPLQVAGCEVSDRSRAPGGVGLQLASGLRAFPGLAAGDCCLVTGRVARAGGGWPGKPDLGSDEPGGSGSQRPASPGEAFG